MEKGYSASSDLFADNSPNNVVSGVKRDHEEEDVFGDDNFKRAKQ
jgi:hypothetical protein